MIITKPGIYPGIDAKAYHADPCEVPSLSSTIAKLLTSRSARHAWTAHPKLGALKEEGDEEVADPRATKSKEKGTLIHRLTLGKGGEVVVCPFENWRKDVAKAMRDVAKSKGQIPTLPHLMEEAETAAKEARKQLDDMGYDYVFRHGINEVVIVWQEEGGVWCRAMIDNLIIDENTKTAELWDLKTTGKSSHPEACGKQIGDLGYDLSLSFHQRGLVTLRPDLAGRIKKRWVFVETDAPYATTPVEISAEWAMAAEVRVERSIALWRRCMTENRWPMYVDQVTRLEPKPWQVLDAFTQE